MPAMGPDANYGHVLAAFAARPAGTFWKARCPQPACAQKPRSTLYFWLGKDGRLMARCWRCGLRNGAEGVAFLKDIAQSKGLSIMDFFPSEGREHKDYARPKLVEQFVYEDADGRPAHRTNRYEPKTFSQERWDHKEGRWLPGLGPYPECPRYLYHCPALLGRPADDVFVVEGERKVLLLESWGLVATCNAGGAGMGWIDGYSQALSGRHVVVLPDNDPPGRRHADLTTGSLIRHGVACVRMVLLPGLPEGGDVLDWSRAGGTKEQFFDLVARTPAWMPGRL